MIIDEFNQGEARAGIEYGFMNREIKHKQSGSSPNKRAHFKDKIKHDGVLLSFGIYSIPYLTVKKQQSLCKIYVKLLAGQFLT